MDGHDQLAMQQELEHFRTEKEKIRTLIGQIGGKNSARYERAVNRIFCTSIGVLFVFDLMRHVLAMPVPLPPLFSLEVGILLVSLKIIWMIHQQSRVEHFQFWILNSIEFRLNDVTKRLQELQKTISAQQPCDK